MPSLSTYVTQADLVPAGTFPFVFEEVSVYEPEDTTKPKSVTYKGKLDGKGKTIFRRIHEKMLWLIADDLTKLGEPGYTDIDLNDAEAIAELMQKYIGTTVNMQVKVRSYVDKSGERREDNDFRIKGLADGSSLV